MRSRYRRSPTVLSRSFAGEAIVATREREDLDHLSGPAGMAWELLSVPRSNQELVALLGELYGGPTEAISSDVQTLLADLVERGLVEQAGADD